MYSIIRYTTNTGQFAMITVELFQVETITFGDLCLYTVIGLKQVL